MNQPLFEIEGSAPFTVYRTADGWTFAANTTGRTYASAEGAAAAAVHAAELALSIARQQVGVAAAADRASMYHACGPLTVVMPIGQRTADLLSGQWQPTQEQIINAYMGAGHQHLSPTREASEKLRGGCFVSGPPPEFKITRAGRAQLAINEAIEMCYDWRFRLEPKKANLPTLERLSDILNVLRAVQP